MRSSWHLSIACGFALALTALGPGISQEPGTKDKDKKTSEQPSEPAIDKLDEDYLRRANLSTDADALIQFFKKRTLSENERPAIEKLVRRLASSSYHVRELATRALVARGIATVEILRQGQANSLDLEATRRIERSLQDIYEKDVALEVPSAAVRVLAQRRPEALIETLLGYVPFAENDAEIDEIRLALMKNALVKEKAHPQLLAALQDRAPRRRAIAGEVLGRVAFAEHKEVLRKMLVDADPQVRFHVARALAFARQADAVPVVIDALPELPLHAAWQAEDFLLRLAASGGPPSAPMGIDKEMRAKCKAAWHAWWKDNEKKIDLARLEDTPKLLGRTLIVLLDQGSVLELGPDNLPRWQLKNIVFPLDAQLIDDERVLIAEYHANRVTERNTRGDILWQKAVAPSPGGGGPLAAQRLPNGNTFIATDQQFLEYDKNDKEVVNIHFPDEGRKIMKAMKLPNGEIACLLADARVVRYDDKGKEISSFTIELAMRLFGGRIHMLPSGRVLIPRNAENKVTEYDAKGKIVWEVPFERPVIATRLPNGNTLITSMNPQVGAVEVDRAGREVWSYRHASNTRVTRAIRR